MSYRNINETFRHPYPQGFGSGTQSLVDGRNQRYVSSTDSPSYPRKQNTLTMYADKHIGGIVTLQRVSDGFHTSFAHYERRALPTVTLSENSEAYVAASNAFYKKAGDHQVNLAMALIESKQTIQMVVSTLRGIVDLVRVVRRGDIRLGYKLLTGLAEDVRRSNFFKDFPDSLKGYMEFFSEEQRRVKDLRSKAGLASVTSKGANDWLALQFGWLPLFSDLHDLCNLEVPSVVPYKVTRRYFYDGESTYPYPLSGTLRYSTKYTRIDLVTFKGKLSFESIPLGQFFGLQSPWLLAWESLPFSFVIDWLLPIGKWIEYQDTLRGVKIIDPSATRSSLITYESRLVGKPAAGVIIKDVIPGWGYLKDRRRVLTVPSVPLPRVKNPLSLVHALDAVALARQQLTKL